MSVFGVYPNFQLSEPVFIHRSVNLLNYIFGWKYLK